ADQLHHEIGIAVGIDAEVVDRNDIGMSQSCDRLRLALKTGHELGRGLEHHLDGDRAIELRIICPIDRAHPTFAQQTEVDIAPQSGRRPHGGIIQRSSPAQGEPPTGAASTARQKLDRAARRDNLSSVPLAWFGRLHRGCSSPRKEVSMRVARRTFPWSIGLLVCPLLMTCDTSDIPDLGEREEEVWGCGVERWSVKTGTDADVATVNQPPQSTTIASLTSITAPASLPPNNRVGSTERQVFRLTNVNLT